MCANGTEACAVGRDSRGWSSWEAPFVLEGRAPLRKPNQSRAPPLISSTPTRQGRALGTPVRRSPRLVASVFLARFARLARYAVEGEYKIRVCLRITGYDARVPGASTS
jgi:hypothetical protein